MNSTQPFFPLFFLSLYSSGGVEGSWIINMEIRELKLGNQFTAKYLHILLKETVHKPHNRVEWFIFWFDLYTFYLWENWCNLVIPAGLSLVGFLLLLLFCFQYLREGSSQSLMEIMEITETVPWCMTFLDSHTLDDPGDYQFLLGCVHTQTHPWMGFPKTIAVVIRPPILTSKQSCLSSFGQYL